MNDEARQSPENHYVMINGSRQGPFTRESLEDQLANGVLNLDTWVWEPSLPDWLPLAELLNIDMPPSPDAPEPSKETAPSSPAKPAMAWSVLIFVVGFLCGCLLTYSLTRAEEVFVKPPLPVQVGFRGSLMDQGLVARFQSVAERPLAMKLRLVRKSGGRDIEGTLVLNPGETKEIGWMEGWAFESGDMVELNHKSFQSARHRAP